MAVTTGIGGGALWVGFTKEQADFLQCPAAGEVVERLHQKGPKDDGLSKEALACVRLVGNAGKEKLKKSVAWTDIISNNTYK